MSTVKNTTMATDMPSKAQNNKITDFLSKNNIPQLKQYLLANCLPEYLNDDEKNKSAFYLCALKSKKQQKLASYQKHIAKSQEITPNCKLKFVWLEYTKYPENYKNEFFRIMCKEATNLKIYSYYTYKNRLDRMDEEEVYFKSGKYLVKNDNIEYPINGEYYVVSKFNITAFNSDGMIGSYLRIH